ncbi:E3 ubiquitin-protein ligase LRSAM1-like isoform X1 [Lytechinus variegatus]|uniref:E3 ubiquitin-protein ligase LRSAM1-like isoform X1 n=2 Tax=Lytechinus variegatus TaxID=7654 RepID=UPI001BB16EDE|nr:E3 ubiquitin-protein ligase LRSAM1-like isoform X1 [Lytechinus variegatus]
MAECEAVKPKSKKPRKTYKEEEEEESPRRSETHSTPTKMPFFKKKPTEPKQNKDVWEVEVMMHKQSDEARKRMEHCQFLAQASPEPDYDLSKCELTEVPAGTFSQCKVFRKEVLIMSDNLLSSLNGGGNIKDLSLLRVLDLRNNRFPQLPDGLTELGQLQVLDVTDNKLKQLPKNIGKLQALQTLNARGNSLKELPESMCQMKSLRTLDISHNQVRSLPRKFCNIKTLESLTLDVVHMTYPSPDICQDGTENIMKYMCAENGIEYSPPSKHLLPVLNTYTSASETSVSALQALQHEEDQLNSSVLKYETKKNQKQNDFARLEQELAQLEAQQAQIAESSNRNRALLLQSLAREQEESDSNIRNIQEKSECERRQMISSLQEVEHRSADLIQQLLEMNEKAKKKEAFLDEMERKMMEDEEMFKIQEEERKLVREHDVLISMEGILRERHALESKRLKYEEHRDSVTKQAMELDELEMNKLGDQLSSIKHNRDEIFKELMQEEEFQRQAFQTLLINKDTRHKRLSETIYMIQQQLAEVTMAEIEKRNMKADSASLALEQKREDLAALLKQLMMQREEREEALKQRMLEMEELRERTEQDYWLVQYQRLLDKKPQSLIDQEHNLELAVVDILQEAGAEDYIPKFARHRVSIETMMQMGMEELREIGVHEVGLRKAILTAVQGYVQAQTRAMEKAAAIERPTEPSAPPMEDGSSKGKKGKEEEEMGAAASSRPVEAVEAPEGYTPDVTVRVTTECVICMEKDSDMLFLMCGHICCCVKCSQPLFKCPLCRGDITSKIIVGNSPVG